MKVNNPSGTPHGFAVFVANGNFNPQITGNHLVIIIGGGSGGGGGGGGNATLIGQAGKRGRSSLLQFNVQAFTVGVPVVITIGAGGVGGAAGPASADGTSGSPGGITTVGSLASGATVGGAFGMTGFSATVDLFDPVSGGDLGFGAGGDGGPSCGHNTAGNAGTAGNGGAALIIW